MWTAGLRTWGAGLAPVRAAPHAGRRRRGGAAGPWRHRGGHVRRERRVAIRECVGTVGTRHEVGQVRRRVGRARQRSPRGTTDGRALYDRRPPVERRLEAHVRRRIKRLVQIGVWLGLALVGGVSRLSYGARRPLQPGDPLIRRILVSRTDLIGDVVLSLPAVHALRQGYPHAELDMLVHP